ncbi:MAG: hypothetical protein GEV11_15540 [Streptosporangiales bacterium]|nr:hypothetical protein [Streptosporangiales bacterium]
MNRHIWAAPVVTVLMLVSGGTAAMAAEPDPYENGNRRGVVLRDSKIQIGGSGAGGGGTVDVDVPDCWYEPKVAPEDMDAWVREHFQGDIRDGVQIPGRDEIAKHRDDKGMFWMPAFMDTAAGVACATDLKWWIFVPEGETPPNGITPEMLARIARAYLEVPSPRVSLNPDARSYVELGTWVWAEGVPAEPLTVTATLPGVASATVVATPGELSIQPGTTDATVHAACGATGKPYPGAGAATQRPPCGVTYHRSSRAVGSYPMEVALRWDVTWNGSGGTGGAMTPVVAGTTRDVVVDEIQTRNAD